MYIQSAFYPNSSHIDYKKVSKSCLGISFGDILGRQGSHTVRPYGFYKPFSYRYFKRRQYLDFIYSNSRYFHSSYFNRRVQISSVDIRSLESNTSDISSLNSDVILEFRDVHKSFGNKKILQGASFKIYRGEAIGIIGGSGTGKSTTLKLLAGLLMPDQGEILINDKKRDGLISDCKEDKDLHIGMVFQAGALLDSLTVGRNVGFYLYEHSQLKNDKIEELVADTLSKVGLKGIENLYPAQLSGGMKKRVALARAIATDHKTFKEQVLLYDEPTAGLDPVASTVIEDLIRSLHTRSSNENCNMGLSISTYIVVTHQQSTIKRAVDRLIFLHEGKVAWEGTTKEFEITDVPIVKQFATGSLDGPIKYI